MRWFTEKLRSVRGAQTGAPLARAWHARHVVTSKGADGETVLLHLPSGTYLALDATASRIVELLNEHGDPEKAAAALAALYGIEPARAQGDVGAVVGAVQGLSAPRTGRGRRPTVAGVRVVTRSWWRQPWRYRMTSLQVVAVAAVVEVGLRTTGVDRLARLLGVPLATGGAPAPALGVGDAGFLSERERRVHWALFWVMTRWLYDGTCLRRALVLGWFLRRRHPVLRLGMLSEGDVAHAWIEVDGRALNTEPVTGVFAGTTPAIS